jgi:hypothetical protein
MGNACKSAKSVSTNQTIDKLAIPIAPNGPGELSKSSSSTDLSKPAEDSTIRQVNEQV